MVRLAVALGFGLGLHQVAAAPAPAAAAAAAAVTLAPGTTWEYPLGYNLTMKNANASVAFYSVDLFNTNASDISALIAGGHYVACYFSAGSVESYRPDAKDFPAAAVGKTMDGWPDEKWIDTRNSGVRSVMQKRIAMAKQKGCQGVDPDNIDGYENETGFPLTEDTGVDYVKWLASTAQAQGLACGLKNGGAIVDRVVSVTAWDIQEQCAQYDECDLYKPFIDAKKPVFHVEYTPGSKDTTVSAANLQKFCGSGGQKGFSTIIKHMSLDSWYKAC